MSFHSPGEPWLWLIHNWGEGCAARVQNCCFEKEKSKFPIGKPGHSWRGAPPTAAGIICKGRNYEGETVCMINKVFVCAQTCTPLSCCGFAGAAAAGGDRAAGVAADAAGGAAGTDRSGVREPGSADQLLSGWRWRGGHVIPESPPPQHLDTFLGL